MALKLIEGFDDGLVLQRGWVEAVSGQIPAWSAGRFGGYAMSMGRFDGVTRQLVPALTGTVIAGFAVRPTTLAAGVYFFTFGVIRFFLQTTGVITVVRGDTSASVASTPSPVWPVANVWRYLEVKYVLATGACELRVDGAVVLNLTLPTSASMTGIAFPNHGSTSAGTIFIDDVYVADVSGTFNANYLGDVRVQTLYPSAEGALLDMTPSTGTSHFSLVDEATPNTTDYVSSATAGVRDTYQFQDLPANTANVYGLEVSNYARKDATPYAGIANVVRVGPTNYPQAMNTLSASWTANYDVIEQNPSTGNMWTPADLNAAEFGVETG